MIANYISREEHEREMILILLKVEALMADYEVARRILFLCHGVPISPAVTLLDLSLLLADKNGAAREAWNLLTPEQKAELKVRNSVCM